MSSDERQPSVVLQFDLGNTCLKWRLIILREVDVEVLDGGRLFWSELEGENAGLFRVLVAATAAVVSHIWVASVVGLEREQRLLQWCNERLGVVPSFARSTPSLADVTNAYRKPERLGVDRWLAIVGAWKKGKGACIVVDAGSAMTVDLLSDQGKHLGGYIAPGLALMRNSLMLGTDAVKVDALSPLSVRPGLDTAQAVTGALAAMVLGLLDSAKKQLCSQLFGLSARRVTLFLTGGDARVLSDLLSASDDFGCEVELDLVFEGLECWGRESVQLV